MADLMNQAQESERELDRLRGKWKAMLTGEAFRNGGGESLWRSKVERVTDQARRLWLTMNTGAAQRSGDLLWPDVPKARDASDIKELYDRLLTMATALASDGSALCGDKRLARSVLDGLQWVYEHRYNEHTACYGNWWYWEIGAPSALLDTMILMRDWLGGNERGAYLRAVDRCVPEPAVFINTTSAAPEESTGANRVWKSRVYLLSALLRGDAAGIAAARDAMAPVFEYVTEGDGFYTDGSFIQHERFPYTGGYGKSLVKELAELIYFLHGSPWPFPPEQVHRAARWIEDSFVPFLFRGMMADMVSGREISREYLQNHESGHIVIGAVLQLAEAAEPKVAQRLKRLAKQWITADTHKDFAAEAPFLAAGLARRLMDDEAVRPAAEERMCALFPQMDRAVYRGPGWLFGISMFSDRTFTYESINGENLHGWYTAHGMTYLYDGDLAHYCDGFWPTVDPYRMAGTTVGAVPREDGYGHRRLGTASFVGGAVCGGMFGAIGMDLEEPGEWSARKSWFLWGDAVVALGSRIRGAAGIRVETIVDNRMLTKAGGNAVAAGTSGNRRVILDSADGQQTLHADWIHLEGNVPGADIGYAFPRPASVQVLRETRTGRWSDINKKGPDKDLARRYVTMWFDHGVQPLDADYAYVLLPGRSAAETAAYADSPQTEIVELSSEVHAVRASGLGLFAAHFWEDGTRTAGPVTCDRKATVLLKEDERTLEAVVADPTQRCDGRITIELDAAAGAVLAKDERITVRRLSPSVIFDVNMAGAAGKSCSVVFADLKLRN